MPLDLTSPETAKGSTETRANEYRAHFTLVGEFDPSTVTARLGLVPSSAWRKGDLNEKTHLERKFSRWNLDARLGSFSPLEDQVADVLDQLEAREEEVTKLLEEADGGMQLVGYFYRDYPSLGFDLQTINRLSRLKLSVDLDFYYLYSDRREDS